MSFSVSLASTVEVAAQASFRNQRQTYSSAELRRSYRFASDAVASSDMAEPAVEARPVSSRRAALSQTSEGRALIQEARQSLADAVEKHGLGALVAMRLRAGLTQKQLCEVTGIPQPHISRLENGRVASPDMKTLAKLAQAVGVSLNEMAKAFAVESA